VLPYLFKRILIALPVLLGVTAISYAIISLAPGNAVDILIDPNQTPGQAQRMREELGLNQPIPVRYAKWLGELTRGNLGYSFLTRRPVAERVRERLFPTLSLAFAAILIAYVVALPVGVISATRQYSAADYLSTAIALVGNSLPTFFLGLGFIYLFSVRTRWFPTGGMSTMGQTPTFSDLLLHITLPALVLGMSIMGAVMRYARSSMLEVMRQDFVRTARAKGVPGRKVLYKHALRNALIPVITLLGIQLPVLIGGAIITEQVFGWPGMGRLTIEAITQRDYPVLMALNLLTAAMVVAGGLFSDVLYAVVDPRIRYA
jgi:peptide/nickel transport system permease protein